MVITCIVGLLLDLRQPLRICHNSDIDVSDAGKSERIGQTTQESLGRRRIRSPRRSARRGLRRCSGADAGPPRRVCFVGMGTDELPRDNLWRQRRGRSSSCRRHANTGEPWQTCGEPHLRQVRRSEQLLRRGGLAGWHAPRHGGSAAKAHGSGKSRVQSSCLSRLSGLRCLSCLNRLKSLGCAHCAKGAMCCASCAAAPHHLRAAQRSDREL
mmetsp:Transcript_22502/g.57539  ORF Transcript_22502/g.57539 Transcript_22502/m.57539 type:complete len:212 (+) Transcript_22502:1227-1862(+)